MNVHQNQVGAVLAGEIERAPMPSLVQTGW